MRSVRLLAVVTAVLFAVDAGAEIWRFVLLARGRTEVLPAAQVRVSDATVVALGWSAITAAALTAAVALALLGRITRTAAQRANVPPPRTPRRQLCWVALPGWNLYGAGVVLCETDGMLSLPATTASTRSAARPWSWRGRDLPGAAERSTEDVAPGVPDSAARRPHVRVGRVVTWWWVMWVVGGLLAAGVLMRTLLPGSLQVEANLVQLHALLDLIAATTAALSAAIAVRWRRLLAPRQQAWPAGWQLVRGDTGSARRPRAATDSKRDQPSGKVAVPSPTTDPVNV